MQILIIEPDHWRYLGISQILESQRDITLLGDPDYKRILGLNSAPPNLRPDVVVVSHSLALDYDLAVLSHLQVLFPTARLLVEGYDETMDGITAVLRAGAKGYFQLSSDPKKLLKAVSIVGKGHIWAPREVMTLLLDDSSPESRRHSARDVVSVTDLAILRLLQQGLGNKEIARALGVAEVTVKAHLSKLFRRFGVSTRLELLAYALTHKILADDHQRAPRTSPRGA